MRPKKIVMRKDFYSSSDCWTKGWDFELHLIARYILILVIGVMGSYAMMGRVKFLDAWSLKTKLDEVTFIFLVIFLISWPIALTLMRRYTCYVFRKDREEYYNRIEKVKQQELGEQP